MSPSVSVVIGWETARLSDLARARARRMLAQLGAQMAEAARERRLEAELLVLYDSEAVDPDALWAAVFAEFEPASWPGTIALVPAPGRSYYEQKNKGGELAKGEIVIFLDSDVVPDEGWLRGLLLAMDDPDVAIVGGETYHAVDTPYDRLCAAFWAFSTKRPPRGVYRHRRFYANNLAVRRAFFLAHPFPDAAAFRGQCAQLAKTLRESGVCIYRQGHSSVSHPPPQGLGAFLAHALCRGHDAVYWQRQLCARALLRTNPAAALVRWVRDLRQVVAKIAARRRVLGLGPLGVLVAIAMGFVYCTFKLVGEVVAFFSPGVIRRSLSV